MTTLRENIIAELERVPEDKLYAIMQFIEQVIGGSSTRRKTLDLEQFVMSPTERGKNADIYVRELRDNDRI